MIYFMNADFNRKNILKLCTHGQNYIQNITGKVLYVCQIGVVKNFGLDCTKMA
jgi:hypothetical protein